MACYRQFIAALLDVTDNIVGGQVVPPRDVVRHDGDDPYLVVAADKGTATFSDIANEISCNYGFWLGDAFASGGSAGYDHKKMGITARGAWESVKRHFRDLGVDTQTQDFTVVGIGDMSGDVFGNGMLLSEHIRLVAAFDHRHIFLDPEPGRGRLVRRAPSAVRAAALVVGRLRPGADLGGRRRLPPYREIGADLAAGAGGARPRRRRHRAVAGRADPRRSCAAPVDLLFNGGIGTYVKASAETHADVGRQGQRRDPGQRQATAGQGGRRGRQPGLTQRGRIEYALAGGRIFTDFIDNSAGVDCSDHEVNIKILLGARRAGPGRAGRAARPR